MKFITEMEQGLYTPQELAAILTEYGTPKDAGFRLHTDSIDSSISKQIMEERKKLTHGGLFHNAGNSEDFINRIVKKFGEKNVRQYTWSHNQKTDVEIDRNGHRLKLEVADDHVNVSYGNYFGKVYVGLHSGFLDEVMSFLLDEDGEFLRLVDRYNKLHDSVEYYNKRYAELSDNAIFFDCLVDKTAFNEFKGRFEDTLTMLQPLSDYLDVSSIRWNEAVRRYGISNALSEIATVKRLATGKTLDKSVKYKKRYEKALAALVGANERGLLTPDDASLLVDWPDFIATLTSEDAIKETSQSYLASIDEAYAKAIKACDASNTAYMRKKKLRLEANMGLCNKLKAAHGLYCFIDNSYFSSKVGHFNVVTSGNMVWIFRIARATPSMEEGASFVDIVKALEQIGKILDKSVNLQNLSTKSEGKFRILKDNSIDDETLKSFRNLTKKIKNGRLDITRLSVKLAVPIGGLEWQITLRRKTAIENLSEILPYIQKYMSLSKNGTGINFKGIFKERQPRL